MISVSRFSTVLPSLALAWSATAAQSTSALVLNRSKVMPVASVDETMSGDDELDSLSPVAVPAVQRLLWGIRRHHDDDADSDESISTEEMDAAEEEMAQRRKSVSFSSIIAPATFVSEKRALEGDGGQGQKRACTGEGVARVGPMADVAAFHPAPVRVPSGPVTPRKQTRSPVSVKDSPIAMREFLRDGRPQAPPAPRAALRSRRLGGEAALDFEVPIVGGDRLELASLLNMLSVDE